MGHNADEKGQHDAQHHACSNLENDIIATDQMKRLAILDEIENKTDILDGSLTFAMDAATNAHSGFYQGLKEQVEGIQNLINRLRN